MTDSTTRDDAPGGRTWPHPSAAQVGPHAQWPGGGSSWVEPGDLRLPQPRERLDPRAQRVWTISEAISGAVAILVIVAIAAALIRFTPLTWPWPVLVTIVLTVAQIVWTYWGPRIRYQQWYYEIRDEEVDLQHGVLTKTRQLIPISRIQHVDTRRGPLQRRYGLSSVVFYTAAGAMEIPALADDVAATVRNRIADLAKVHDDL